MLEQVLASRYRLIQPLVLGGFGQTYLAQDILLPGHPDCFVKKLHPSSSDSSFLEIARRLFNSEAEVLQKVGDHPQIPSLLAYFEQDREFYLVQEFIYGTTLQDVLSVSTCLSEFEVIALLQDCLEVLDFVHGQGVIHRDIKPANLMIRQVDGKMVLLDFGAVKQISVHQSQTTTATVVIGTQGYMPDEQTGGRPNFTSDLYALGVIGIQALTGLEPMDLGRGPDDEIDWQPQLTITPDLTRILSKMVRRDYRQRYQSAAEVRAALSAISTPSPSAAIPGIGVFATNSAPKVKIATNGKQSSVKSAETVKQSESPPPGLAVVPAGMANPTSHSMTRVQIPKASSSWRTTVVTPTQPATLLNMNAAAGRTVAHVTATGIVADRYRFRWPKSTKVAVASLIVLLLGAAAGGTYYTRRAALAKTLGQLGTLYDEAKYTECISAAEAAIANLAIPSTSLKGPMARCQLGTAQIKANQSSFADAIGIVSKISPETSYYQKAQQKINTWSTEILAYATKTYEEQGKLKEALAAASVIPKTTAVAQEVATRTKQWQANNKTNEALIKAAETDLQDGRPEDAIAKVEKIQEPKYWKQKADKIIQEANQQIAKRSPPAPVRSWQPTPAPQQLPAYAPAQRQAPTQRQQVPIQRQQAPAKRQQGPSPKRRQGPPAKRRQGPPAKRQQAPAKQQQAPAKRRQRPSAQRPQAPVRRPQAPVQRRQRPSAQRRQGPPAQRRQGPAKRRKGPAKQR